MTDSLFQDTPSAPSFDPELAGVIGALQAATPHVNDETLPLFRKMIDEAPRPDLTADGAVTVTEHVAAGPGQSPGIPLTVLVPASGAADRHLTGADHGSTVHTGVAITPVK